MKETIPVIINPASGRSFPILQTLNAAFARHKTPWEPIITEVGKVEDAVEQALKLETSMVAVYGGDGTVSEVAGLISESEKVLGIIPGGTGNVLAAELGLSQDIRKACLKIASGKGTPKSIDAGRIGSKTFLLRVSLGFEAEIVKATDRSQKSKFGILAYAFSGLKALIKTKPTQYSLVLDGEHIECEGLSLLIANSGNLGVPGISLYPGIKIDDGLLDVILIRQADLSGLAELKEGNIHPKSIVPELFKRWQAKTVVLNSAPQQSLHYDGEELNISDQIHVEILPKAIKVLT